MIEELRSHYLNHLPDDTSICPDVLTYLDKAAVTHDYDLQLADAIRRTGNMVLGVYHFEDSASL